MSWCKCPLVGMPWCECLLGSMLWCHDANVPFGVYHNANVPLVHAMMRMPLVRMSWCKCFEANTIYSKIPLFSKWGFLSAWNQNIFRTWFIIPEKSSSFWLKAPKKLVITVRNLRMRHWLRIWWSGSKDLFSQFDWAKKVAHFQGLFWKRWILWKSSILKWSIFFSPWIWQFDRRQDLPW